MVVLLSEWLWPRIRGVVLAAQLDPTKSGNPHRRSTCDARKTIARVTMTAYFAVGVWLRANAAN
jgi:hypothetical protein